MYNIFKTPNRHNQNYFTYFTPKGILVILEYIINWLELIIIINEY